ncbi:MAG: tetratricopeptide repeat protein [Candidatus Methanomethylophilaceae archaeon]|nr:tetratricopeptide repeat protein [Candidatus Methanomethylophilaceae archaeon]MDD3127988.1 tetratricopeptide repeat protein [Candidatus Methanomethylophilaceae archaeon]MDD4454922.1 tetratricopeptide repeat protein [Candidatus Methanomethylophilaceae archaeon]
MDLDALFDMARTAESEGDYEKAVSSYSAAADRDHAGSQCALAELYMSGRGVEKDHVRGRMLFQAAAELGSAEALYGLGVIYWGGYGVERNEKRAIEYLGAAADKGIVAAAAELGMMHYFSERKDSGSALRRFVQAAEAGDVTSMYMAGVMYEEGDGTPADTAEAEKWFALAADMGVPEAKFRLASIYRERKDAEGHREKAEALYRESAQCGMTEAMFNLAAMLCERGDHAGAVGWYRSAAEKNDPDSQFFLGMMYLEGKGVMKDPKEGITWLRVSADNGNEMAREVLAKAGKDRHG